MVELIPKSPLYKLKKSLTILLFISLILELIFFFSLENVYASIILFLGWSVTKSFVLTEYRMLKYPVSFIMIFGLSILHYILPLPLTLIELKPITYNLNIPFITFTHHFLFVLVIVLAHRFYVKFSGGVNVFRNFLKKTDFYRIPSNQVIWIAGFLGVFSSFYLYFIMGVWQMERSDRNTLYYILVFFSGYIWMPLILYFPKFREKHYNTKKLSITIILFSAISVFIAIASNWRTAIFNGIFLFICLLVLSHLYGYIDVFSVLKRRKIAIALLIGILLVNPLIDLSYAMVVVRHERTQMNALEFVQETLVVFQDKELLKKVKSLSASVINEGTFNVKPWDETYLENIVTNRFVNLKISDNCLYYAGKVGYSNPKFREELINQIISIFPNTILSLFNYDVTSKLESTSYSIGDFLYATATNNENAKGSSVISSIPGVGMAIFGYWYLLIIFPLFIVIFYMFDSFVNISHGKIIFSFFFFIMLVPSFNYFNDRHVFTFEFKFILRTYFESIFVFLILYKLFLLIERFYPIRKINIKNK